MDILIIIPVHNEEKYLLRSLGSLVEQTLLPKKIIIVNDNSTDGTQKIIDHFVSKYDFICTTHNTSESKHQPGAKVINAFYQGLDLEKGEFDLIGKFDGDIVLPSNYFERMVSIFNLNNDVGIAGGNLYIKKNESWEFENISEKTKVRGPIKLYRKQCFRDIGGLKKSIGWDTVDELLAQFHGWKIQTDTHLKVKHLKPTGNSYTKNAKYKQGEAFYRMRYGFLLSTIAAAKLAFKKRSLHHFIHAIQGYIKASDKKLIFIVSKEEGKFIRALRWKGIKNKIL